MDENIFHEKRSTERKHLMESYIDYKKSGIFALFWNLDCGMIEDLSKDGAQFVLKDMPPEPGSTFNFEIDVPAYEKPIRAEGRIIWMKYESEAKLYRVGVNLHPLSKKDQEKITFLMHQRSLQELGRPEHRNRNEFRKAG